MDWHWETQKQKLKKESWQRTSGTTKWHKLAQDGVQQAVQGEAGLQIYVEQVEQGEGGLQIVVEQVEQGQGVCPTEPPLIAKSVYKTVHLLLYQV